MSALDYKALGQRIRKARRARNMTQERLAEVCALSTAHIGHIERGTRVPSLETVFRISEELSVSIDELVFDSVSDKENALSAVSRSLVGKKDSQVRTFISTVKALADKIDDL